MAIFMCSHETCAGVVLDLAIDKELDYLIPSSMQKDLKVGSRVLVPVKNSLRKGTLWRLKTISNTNPLKPIHEILSEDSVLSSDLIFLAEWMSKYYLSPMHKVLKTILPSSIRSHMKELTQLTVKRAQSKEKLAEICQKMRLSHPKQALILDFLLNSHEEIFLTDLMKKTGVSKSPIETLEKKKLIKIELAPIHRLSTLEQEYFQTKPKPLTEEQTIALDRITSSLHAQRFSTHLLYGITGSGKTEVYLQAIEAALLQKKGVIFLVPEILLTSQTIERLKSRFKEKIALLHHRLSEGEKRDSWHHILSGKAPIVIGARSAIFCPVPNLQLIIVDEEHDSAYKHSDDSPCYHARDVAVMRGKLCNATVVLGSATPSLESYKNAIDGKYVLSTLSHRPGKATLAQVQIIDMKKECLKHKGYTLFSDPLIKKLKERLQKGEQSLILLNRRGYHTSQICLHCSHIASCPHCKSSLTFHLGENILACHLCDYREIPTKTCFSCKKDDSLKFRGAGTELAEKSLYRLFPESRILRMDADTTRLKGSHESLFRKFRSGKADILVGTQMIAKGLHFPSVTLVGVLSADTHLHIPDFRSSETLFQLLTQVAGRAGRGDIPGEVIVQTFLPEHSTLHYAETHDYLGFFNEEIQSRQIFHYPPYTHLIKLTFTGKIEDKTKHSAHKIRQKLIQTLPSSFEILPVTACGYAKIQDYFRFQCIIKTDKVMQAAAFIPSLLGQNRDADVRFQIDVDPLSTFL